MTGEPKVNGDVKADAPKETKVKTKQVWLFKPGGVFVLELPWKSGRVTPSGMAIPDTLQVSGTRLVLLLNQERDAKIDAFLRAHPDCGNVFEPIEEIEGMPVKTEEVDRIERVLDRIMAMPPDHLLSLLPGEARMRLRLRNTVTSINRVRAACICMLDVEPIPSKASKVSPKKEESK